MSIKNQTIERALQMIGMIKLMIHSTNEKFSVINLLRKISKFNKINTQISCLEQYNVCFVFIKILKTDLIRLINDPEHPLTLEELHVVQQSLIKVDNEHNEVFVNFTPTIPHCSMATLIGLSIRVKLLRSLPPRFKVTVEITPGTHTSEVAVNKQLADKERVAAALENSNLINVINQCISV